MVLDASVVLEVILRTPESDAIADRILSSRERLHAPHLLDLPLTRYSHEPLLSRIWALRERLTAYDAAYVALAEALADTLLTRDQRLARTTGIRARIQLA